MSKKKAVMFFVIISLLITNGCAAKKASSAAEQPVVTEAAEEEAKKSGNENEGSAAPAPTEEMKEEEFVPDLNETFLGVTKEIKEAFIQNNDQDTYDLAVIILARFMKINNNSIVGKKAIAPLKEKYKFDTFKIASTQDGHEIPVDYVRVDEKNDRDTVVMVHGQGCTRRTNLGVEEAFLKLGCNVLALDLASSGENKAPYTTYGILEQYDILDCINYIKEQTKEQGRVFLFGCSYGGNVVSVALGNENINEKIAGAILDCPLEGMSKLLQRYLSEKDGKKAESVLDGCSQLMEALYGYSIDAGNGAIQISKTSVPVLIYTSKADDVVPMEDSQELFDAIPHDKKYLCVFETSGHTCGINSDTESYIQHMQDFIDGKLLN